MKTSKKRPRINTVESLAELANLTKIDPNYRRLAVIAASNLGGPSSQPYHTMTSDLRVGAALEWLITTALETSEDGVVEEVNSCRDLI